MRQTAVRQRNMLVTAFHPELNDDLTVHRYFLEMVKEAKTAAARKSAAV